MEREGRISLFIDDILRKDCIGNYILLIKTKNYIDN